MIIGGIGSGLDMGGVDRGLGGIGLSFNKNSYPVWIGVEIGFGIWSGIPLF